ncbi:LAFE_0E05336g1_1 [Lachancea fermentati]|uniref:LAFE_0E05336g1_1 n=1 Tax=Lachancea fermentati TaxID=4955 RepID=A0A1G4MCW5_LACFM|nr:LAFE_0E05336g1_1 [Lachancea fermentati]
MSQNGIRLTRWLHHRVSSPYKRWRDLSLAQKQEFVHRFVDNYSAQYPGSKTNVSLRGLALDMEQHNDAPSVFGLFYDDILKLSEKSRDRLYANQELTPKRNNIAETGRFGHESFYDLLIDNEM